MQKDSLKPYIITRKNTTFSMLKITKIILE